MKYVDILELAWTQSRNDWCIAKKNLEQHPENKIFEAREKRLWKQTEELDKLIAIEKGY